MARELIYTSVPKGLRAGTRGFCTVAVSSGMPKNLVTVLESLSGYRHAFGLGDQNAKLNPVVWAHLQISVGRKKHHVLSRVADAGQDYTQRSNKLAHHLVLEANELCAAGPAWVLSQPGVAVARWEGEPRELTEVRSLPEGVDSPRVCRAWQQVAGDAGWAGVLAQSVLDSKIRQAVVVFQPGQDTLGLVSEAMSLLPAERRWDVSFSTFFTKLPPGVDCKWRFVLEGSPEAKAARRAPQTLFLDLTKPLPRAEDGPLVEVARTGKAAKEVEAETQPQDRGGPPSRREAAPPVGMGRPGVRGGPDRAGAAPAEPQIGVVAEEEPLRRTARSRWLMAAVILLLIIAGVTIAVVMSPGGGRSPVVEPPPSVAQLVPDVDPTPVGPPPEAIERVRKLLFEADQQRMRADRLARDGRAAVDVLDAVRAWSERRAEFRVAERKIDGAIEGAQDADVVRSMRRQFVERRQGLPAVDWGQVEDHLQQVHRNREQALAALKESQAAYQDAQSLLEEMGGSPAVFSLRGQAKICAEKIRLTRNALQQLADVSGELQTCRDLRQWHTGLDSYVTRVDAKIESLAKAYEERKRAFNPFRDLPDAVDLPPESGLLTGHRFQELGDLPLPEGIRCQLNLLGNVIGDGSVFKLQVMPNGEQSSSGGQRWAVKLDKGRGVPPVRIAEIRVAAGKLGFCWQQRPGEARHIRNCVLKMRAGDHRKSVQLRKPVEKAVTLRLDGTIQKVNIPDFPAGERVQVDWSLPTVPPVSTPMTDHPKPAGGNQPPESTPPAGDETLGVGLPSGGGPADAAEPTTVITGFQREIPLAVLEFWRWKEDDQNINRIVPDKEVGKAITFYLLIKFYFVPPPGGDGADWQMKTLCGLTQRETRVSPDHPELTSFVKFSWKKMDLDSPVGDYTLSEDTLARIEKLVETNLAEASAATASSSEKRVAEHRHEIRSNRERILAEVPVWLGELEAKNDPTTSPIRDQIRKFLKSGDLEDLPTSHVPEEIKKCREQITKFADKVKKAQENRIRLAKLEALDQALEALKKGCRLSGRVYVTYPTNDRREPAGREAEPHEVDLLRFVTGTEF